MQSSFEPSINVRNLRIICISAASCASKQTFDRACIALSLAHLSSSRSLTLSFPSNFIWIYRKDRFNITAFSQRIKNDLPTASGFRCCCFHCEIVLNRKGSQQIKSYLPGNGARVCERECFQSREFFGSWVKWRRRKGGSKREKTNS